MPQPTSCLTQHRIEGKQDVDTEDASDHRCQLWVALALIKPGLRTALDEIDIWEKVSRSTDFKHY
jgi:hypothetical protein